MPSHWERPSALLVVCWESQPVGGMHFFVLVVGRGEEVEGSGMHTRTSGWK